jgi:predicted phage gp36 major capsid-like protein
MWKPCAVLAIASMLSVPIVHADDHLVSRDAVKERLADATTERARNLAAVDGVLASPSAAKVASRAGVDLKRVRTSLPRLSDADLRELSQRAAALNSDPVAGHYHDAEDALVFVIVIAAAALLIIAVADRA